MTRRVVITGVGVVSPIGNGFGTYMEGLYSGRSGVTPMTDWKSWGLQTAVAGRVQNFDGQAIPRNIRRSMSLISQYAYEATVQALRDANLPQDLVENERTGISYGSTMGGTSAIADYLGSTLRENKIDNVLSTTFLKIMSHTCAANLAVSLKIPGRVIASCTACASSTQAIGFGYEAIKYDQLDRAICGGAEELHVSVAGVFDVLRSTTSKFNDTPNLTPKPFDSERDGIVIAEGGGTFILEELEAAQKRGAKIYAEVTGYYTNNDATHMTNPNREGLKKCMDGALKVAGLNASDIGYVNCHATATDIGDIAESKAVEDIFGSNMPVSSLKGHYGHMMGACGVVESAACLGMIMNSKLIPTLNLSKIDEKCGNLDFVMEKSRDRTMNHILKNSFAFGGINASLVFSKLQ